MTRADEHEGQLSDPEAKRRGDIAAKRARRVEAEDLAFLTDSVEFKRWLGKRLVPMLANAVRTTNGSEIQYYVGQLNLLREIHNELETFSPGFLESTLEVRRLYEQSLAAEPQKDK